MGCKLSESDTRALQASCMLRLPPHFCVRIKTQAAPLHLISTKPLRARSLQEAAEVSKTLQHIQTCRRALCGPAVATWWSTWRFLHRQDFRWYHTRCNQPEDGGLLLWARSSYQGISCCVPAVHDVLHHLHCDVYVLIFIYSAQIRTDQSTYLCAVPWNKLNLWCSQWIQEPPPNPEPCHDTRHFCTSGLVSSPTNETKPW